MTKYNQILLRQKTKMTEHKKSKYKYEKLQKQAGAEQGRAQPGQSLFGSYKS